MEGHSFVFFSALYFNAIELILQVSRIEYKGQGLDQQGIYRVVYELWKELPIVDVLGEFSVAHYAIWLTVRASQMLHCLALNFAAIGNCFTTEWFSWKGIVLVLTTIVIHSWAWDNSWLARNTQFSNTTPTRRFQRERKYSGSIQPIFKN